MRVKLIKINPTAKPSVKRDRARRRLLESMHNANKTFKQLRVKPIKFLSKWSLNNG